MKNIFYLLCQIKARQRSWVCCLFACLLAGTSEAQQNFPVQLVANISPPHSPYLSDYQYAHALSLNILLKGRVAYAGYLRIKLESIDGRGIVLQTRANYAPLVDLGTVQTLTGAELSPYFSQENLDFAGYDRNSYLRTKRLPDGIYRLSFAFYDQFRPDKRVSNADIFSQKMLRVISLNPPLINLPISFATENYSNQSNQPVNIHWMRPANTPFSLEYELVLNELRPGCQDKYNGAGATASRVSQGEIFNCLGPEIYRTTTTALNYSYGMQAEPMLRLGTWYAVRIRARDPLGRTLFANNGVSQTRVFRYGKPCPVPARLQVRALNPYQVLLNWDALGIHTGYTVHFKHAGDAYKWHRKAALSNQMQINDLEPGTRYLFRVAGDCNASESEQGTVFTVDMPTPPPSLVQCGKDLSVDLSNQAPAARLKPGDKVIAGDFEVILLEVRALGGGYFAGKGQTSLKIFQNAKAHVAFERARINSSRQLIEGSMSVIGGGLQVVSDVWREQYLGFTNEVNRLFAEIDKGLDKVAEVLGKIDKVLEEIEGWVKDYKGEDKAELLETIRIGRKLVTEGKEALEKGKTKEGLKKLKDGSGKVLEVGAKVVKNVLKAFFASLQSLLKATLGTMKRGSKQKKDSLATQTESHLLTYQKLREEVVNEDHRQTIQVTPRRDSSRTARGISTPNNTVPASLFPAMTHAEQSGTLKAERLDSMGKALYPLYRSFDLESIRLEQVKAFLTNPAKFSELLGKIKGALEKLGKEAPGTLLGGKAMAMQDKVRDEVNKLIDHLAETSYNGDVAPDTPNKDDK